MNNNEKKVKYFLRKTAYGLASMSAAFVYVVVLYTRILVQEYRIQFLIRNKLI